MKFKTISNLSKTVACPNCYGSGTGIHSPDGDIYYKDCRRCKGTGKLTPVSLSEFEAVQLEAIADRRAYWYDR